MVALAKYMIKSLPIGTRVKFLQDFPDLNILRGDFATISGRSRLRGKLTTVRLDDKTKAEVPPNTIVQIIKEYPLEVRRRKVSWRKARRFPGLVYEGTLDILSMDWFFGKPKRGRRR